MNINNENTDQESLVLPEKITIAECEEQFLMLTERIKNNNKLVIDATSVKQIDTAALQLFSVLIKSNDVDSYDISWSDVSEELLERASMLGLNKCFEINQS